MLNVPMNLIDRSDILLNSLATQSWPKVERAPAYTVQLDSAMVITGVDSPASQRLLECATGKNFIDELSADSSGYTAKLFSALFADRQEIRELMFNARESKSRRALAVSGVPNWDEGGNFVGYTCTVEDLGTPKVSARDISQYESILGTFVRQVPNLVVVKDMEGRYLTVNPLAERCYGLPLASLIGRTAAEALPDDVAAECCRGDEAVLESEETQEVEQQFAWPDGVHTFRTVKFSIHDWQNCLVGIGSVGVDITRHKQMEDQLYRHANFDVATGLPNQRLILDRVDQAIALSQRAGTSVGAIMIDVGYFNVINEILGSESSDKLLKEVAEAIRSVSRRTDTVGRISGDLFCVMLPNAGSHDDVRNIAEKLLGTLKKIFAVDNLNRSNIGFAMYPMDAQNGEELLGCAKLALDQAKASNRSTVRSFSSSSSDPLVRRSRIIEHLAHAVERNELKLVYQPIVEAKTRAMVGAEALLRWENPELGAVRPDEFIPIAEEAGLISSIGTWVIQRACAEAKIINEKSARPLVISINVSVKQLINESVVGVLAETLQSVGLDPRLIKVEMTETAFAGNAPIFGETMNHIRALGVCLSLDDFGTGYSSLSYLHQFSFNQLKIDKSFIGRITSNKDSVLLVKGIVRMAHSLRLDVVAEGVETEDQLKLLRDIGCDKIQGYLISRPVTFDALQEKLEDK